MVAMWSQIRWSRLTDYLISDAVFDFIFWITIHLKLLFVLKNYIVSKIGICKPYLQALNPQGQVQVQVPYPQCQLQAKVLNLQGQVQAQVLAF